MAVKAMADQVITVNMRIVAPGIAAFDMSDVRKHPPEIARILASEDGEAPRGMFRNHSFRSLANGTNIIATFRVSIPSKRRTLISVTKASDLGIDAHDEAREEDDSTSLTIPVKGTKPGFDGKLASEFDAVLTALKETIEPDSTTTTSFRKNEDNKPKTIEVDAFQDSKKASEWPFSKEFVSKFYLSHETKRIFSAAKLLLEAEPKRAVTMLVTGPSGYGKTSLAEGFASSIGYQFLRLNCASIRDPEEWFGYREAIDGSTVFVPNELTKALRTGKYVICFDEYNRIEPDVHNTLLPLLDHGGRTNIHNEEIVVPEHTVFLATINTGYEYTGTFQLDAAVLNRFELFLEVQELPPAEESKVLLKRYPITKNQAEKLVGICSKIRITIPSVHCSVRTSLNIARQLAAGVSMKDAILNVLQFRTVDGAAGSLNTRKELIDIVNTAGIS
jgi:hypothetical protein